MTSRVIMPFNNNPSSVSVKTTSYTIPAGKYAQVYIEADSGGIFTIDGVSAVVTAAFVNIDVGSTAGLSITYTAPTGYRSKITTIAQAATTYSLNSNASSSQPASTYTQVNEVGPSGTVLVAGATGFQYVQGVAIPSNATSREATFWLPTGTVISGSGNWKAVVQEFYSIS